MRSLPKKHSPRTIRATLDALKSLHAEKNGTRDNAYCRSAGSDHAPAATPTTPSPAMTRSLTSIRRLLAEAVRVGDRDLARELTREALAELEGDR